MNYLIEINKKIREFGLSEKKKSIEKALIERGMKKNSNNDFTIETGKSGVIFFLVKLHSEIGIHYDWRNSAGEYTKENCYYYSIPYRIPIDKIINKIDEKFIETLNNSKFFPAELIDIEESIPDETENKD